MARIAVNKAPTGRALSEPFKTELLDSACGISLVLDQVKRDSTLDMEIREDYFNIYYRGCSLAKVSRNGRASYPLLTDEKYLASMPASTKRTECLTTPESAEGWVATWPHLKNSIDLVLGQHPKTEREYQQLVARDNNVDKHGTSSDYYICDLEYAAHGLRFDLVAVHWPSTSAARKNRHGLGLAVIEVKVLDGALGGSAGLAKHLQDYHDFVTGPKLEQFRDEMRKVFSQKVDLGLVECKYPVESFSDEVPSLVLMLVNHDPASSKLRTFLSQLPSLPDVDLKVATACFAGYSLFDEAMYGVDEFMTRFKTQIYSKDWPAG